MIGSIAGDIIGSVYERGGVKNYNFPLFIEKSVFTDDSVMTVAIADSILHNIGYRDSILKYGRAYPRAGYGASFMKWLIDEDPQPYNSWGNGSAMRVGPVGFAFNTLDKVLREAKKTAEITHNHPEGIKGAQATASAIFMARKGCSKQEIKSFIQEEFNYNLNRTLDDIRPDYQIDVSCQGSVPEAIISFLESTDYESAVRLAISLGGDTDTQACIAGGIAQAFYGSLPELIVSESKRRLTPDLLAVVEEWEHQFG